MKTRLFTTNRGKATWFCRALAAVLMPVLFVTAPCYQAYADPVVPNATAPSAPSQVAPLHAPCPEPVPHSAPLPAKVTFSAHPTDAEIFSKQLLTEPLVPIGGQTSDRENQALAAALLSFQDRKVRD